MESQESPRNKEALWLVGFPSLCSRSRAMKPTVVPRKHGDSCVALCETVRAFVHAVNQLFRTPPTPHPHPWQPHG